MKGTNQDRRRKEMARREKAELKRQRRQVRRQGKASGHAVVGESDAIQEAALDMGSTEVE